MTMPPYPITCTSKGCQNLAEYKIAARWSDGLIGELKTYALCCAGCLETSFRESLRKQAACRLAPGESLEPPGIYHLERGQRDKKLQRQEELERHLKEKNLQS
jgi:hypothetical protein